MSSASDCLNFPRQDYCLGKVSTTQDVAEDLTEKKFKQTNGVLGTELSSSCLFIPQSQLQAGLDGNFWKEQTHVLNLEVGKSHLQKSVGKRLDSTDSNKTFEQSEDIETLDTGNMDDYKLVKRNENILDEARQLETLEAFGKEFKQKRIRLGYTQGDVGHAIGHLYGNDFSQTTISRFEALNLSFKNMLKLKPLLERWLEYANKLAEQSRDGGTQPVPPEIPPAEEVRQSRKRKKRTSIDQNRKKLLDEQFDKNPKPTSDDLNQIAEECEMEKEVVRVWFCNRRQKEKRIAMHEQQSHEEPLSPDGDLKSIPLHDNGMPSSTEMKVSRGISLSSKRTAYPSIGTTQALSLPVNVKMENKTQPVLQGHISVGNVYNGKLEQAIPILTSNHHVQNRCTLSCDHTALLSAKSSHGQLTFPALHPGQYGKNIAAASIVTTCPASSLGCHRYGEILPPPPIPGNSLLTSSNANQPSRNFMFANGDRAFYELKQSDAATN
ncbi:uncharacterized protein LOC143445906 isoform X2 [Clavelina lepadiformis]